MTSHPEFHANTEALEVAKAFPDQIRGKTVLVTGVNRAGIGYATAEAFASQSPAHLIAAGRTLSKLQESIDAMKAQFPDVDYRPLLIDLSSQKSVRAAAAELLSWADVPTIDIIVNSAGIMLLPTRTLSEDGIEMHFATNHIGHFLFANLVMPKVIKAAQGNPKGATRIINVSSGSPQVAAMRWSDTNFDKKNADLPAEEQPNYQLHQGWGYGDTKGISYVPLEGYNQSKVANVLFSIAATKRLYEKYGILSLGLHPGVIQTELPRSAAPETREAVQAMVKAGAFSYRTLGAGASTSLVAALDPKLGPGQAIEGKTENYGAFLEDCQICDKADPRAVSSEQAERLWKLSEELVGEQFSW
ncbi:putative short-chain dehydrogenase [Thozetella sp. PMI_491]|nr:putative short-chain dehydrogenase [Thozetella sp. PMI_491]